MDLRKPVFLRRCIVPGNTASLWAAVTTAKDVNANELPNNIHTGISHKHKHTGEVLRGRRKR